MKLLKFTFVFVISTNIIFSQQLSPEQMELLKSKAKEMGMSDQQIEQQQKSAVFDVNKFIQGEIKTATNQTIGKIIDTTLIPNKDSIKKVIPIIIPGFTSRIKSKQIIEPFGYNIYKSGGSLFAQSINIPTPLNYLIGPGDDVLLTMWGEAQAFYQFSVNRDGQIVIPTVGPVVAQGITVETLQKRLLSKMTPFYSGLRNGGANANTFLDVSLGKLRTIQIFVLGDVQNPGSYAIPSMSTSFNALFVAGGPSINGSLRNISLIRAGKTITNLDMYNFLLSGDKSDDSRLQDGDIIFVNRIGMRVAVVGNVLRPAIYELKEKNTLSDAISISGGLMFDSYFDRVHIERIIPFDERTKFNKDILDLDYRFNSVNDLKKSKIPLSDGDIITIDSITNLLENRIFVNGSVRKPGVQESKKNMRVRDAILQADNVLSNTFMERATLIRTLINGKQKSISLNLNNVMRGDSAQNILLEPLDSIIVYDQEYFFPQHYVEVAGAVKNPGRFKRYLNMSLNDLIVMAGGLTEEASWERIYIANKDTSRIGVYAKSKFINLQNNYWQSQKNSVVMLEDFDYVYVPFDPKIVKPRLVSINGEVNYPGQYILENESETLSDLIKRAGGLKDNAYLKGSRLERTKKSAGLVPIDFESILNGNYESDFILEEGDIIVIERDPKIIYLRGEVVVQSSARYIAGKSLSYYLKQAGGVSENGDPDRVTVTLPNGKKMEKGWFFDEEIISGSVISVPAKIKEEEQILPILRDWSTIVMSIATMFLTIMQVTK
ncbi:MAG: SLBB domain-containing protein [Bacteroidetes bacterium]|nr:SLBB domain-containing protein [Bacteroidota bacterium]